ncbi:MAG: glycosyltransferase [Beijerinckiaceae bacterium]
MNGLQVRAGRNGVPVIDQALADGLVDDVSLYKALADTLRVPFVRATIEMAPMRDGVDALRSGIAPAQTQNPQTRFIMAPRGQALSQVLQRFDHLAFSGAEITTPHAFQQALIRANRASVVQQASFALAQQSPDDTAHALRRPATMLLFMMCVLLMFLAGVSTQGSVLRWISLALGFLFFLNVSIRLSALIAVRDRSNPSVPPLPDHALPVYSVLVPLYREAKIIPALVDALSALDYPRAKLDIRILVEENDRETWAALKSLSLPPFIQATVIPAGRPQTKPRALNIGLALARGALCTVYDAEDRPAADQLRKAAALFAVLPRDYACVQAKLAIDHADETWITRLFALEYAALFDVIVPGLAAQELPFGLGGTSNHFRVTHLRAAGGWDAWNVTEDADLGMRLFRKGFRVGVLDSTTYEEAPVRFGMWFSQRTRWMKGWIQTSLVHLRAPSLMAAGTMPFAWAAAHALTCGTVISALFGPLLMTMVAYELIGGWLNSIQGPVQFLIWTFALTLSLVGMATMFLLGLAGAYRRGLMRLAPWIIAFPVYYLLISVAAWWGLVEFLVQPHHWRKTDHGIARQRAASSLPELQKISLTGTSPAPRLPVP